MSVFNGVILKYILKNSIKMTPTVRTLLLGRKMLSVIMFLSSPRWPLTLSLIIYRWRLDIKLHSDINLMAQMCSDCKNLGAHFRSPHPLSHCSIIAVMRLSMFPVCAAQGWQWLRQLPCGRMEASCGQRHMVALSSQMVDVEWCHVGE